MSDLDRIAAVARDYARELNLEIGPYEPHGWRPEAAAWPALHLEDLSAIPFLTRIAAVDAYQHRARVRARDGDLFAAVGGETPGYEAYCRRLGLGKASFIQAEPVEGRLAVARACQEGHAFQQLVAQARDAGALSIQPYMSIESVWDLARKLHQAARVPVCVGGPPPPVTWLANDKAFICELTRRLVGERALVDERLGWGAADLASALKAMSGDHDRVALKRVRCASAMGNKVFDSHVLRGATDAAVRAMVEQFLEDTEWDGNEPVLVVAWEAATASPSTQLWIPPLGAGSPTLDGVYEQLLEGTEQVFLGSVPSALGPAVDQALGAISLVVAQGLQAVGYVGRCSFDFLLLGDAGGDFEVRLTECNGRWGGTSTPMHLVERLGGAQRPYYLAQDYIDPSLEGLAFDELLSRVGDAVYDPSTGKGRFIFYNAGCLAPRGKFDVVVLAEDRQDALERGVPELTRRLAGRA